MNKLHASSLIIIGILMTVPTQSAEDKLPINFEVVDIQERCFILYSLINTPEFKRRKGASFLEEKLVIDNQSAYDEFQKKISKARYMACKDVAFPSVDFSQKVLLGNWASGSCAAYGFKREVSQDPRKREIIYSIEVQERRDIRCFGRGLHSMNLISIPKIPKDYKITFKPLQDDHRGFQTYSFENGKTVARDWWGNIVPRRTSPPPGGGVFGVEFK